MSLILSGDNGVTFPNSTVQASAGVVLQVVNASYGTSFTTTSASLVTTGITASITPKFSTSKILVLINTRGYVNSATSTQNFAIFRNSTNLTGANGYSSYTTATLIQLMQSFQYLDSPATTSATTYTLYTASPNGTTIVGTQPNGSGDFPASITLMEIAG